MGDAYRSPAHQASTYYASFELCDMPISGLSSDEKGGVAMRRMQIIGLTVIFDIGYIHFCVISQLSRLYLIYLVSLLLWYLWACGII